MRKLISFIATSLDGYIAGPQHQLDWLFTEGDCGFSTLMQRIDCCLMGAGTFRETRKFGPVFPGKRVVVFSRSPQTLTYPTGENVEFTSEDPTEFTRKLLQEDGKQDVWVVGGGQVNTALMDLIDEYVVSIHPIILGAGVPLFINAEYGIRRLTLIKHEAFDTGLVQLTYHK